MVGHVTLLHIDEAQPRVILGSDDERGLTLIAVFQGTHGMAAIVQVFVVDGRLPYPLTVDIDGGVGTLRIDGDITADTDIQVHLVSTGTVNGYGVEVFTQHTVVLMLDGQSLGTTGHVEPYLTVVLLTRNDTQRTTVERKPAIGSLNLDQRRLLTILV